jgi:DhnA family fructose-bisphosphate aldolase class Ia
MTVRPILAPDGRAVVVAIDHGLYSWPVPGLEDRGALLRTVAAAGADAIITSFGTLRDYDTDFGAARRILKLDLTTVAVNAYLPSAYRLAWTLDDARRLRADAVLTYVQLGSERELDELEAAARIAAAADASGIPYVCEIMPVESQRFPDPYAPDAIAAAARTGAELGATIVKTSIPVPANGVATAVGCGLPVLLAGGDVAADRAALIERVRTLVAEGASGVAFGRNVWTAPDPASIVHALCLAVHDNT